MYRRQQLPQQQQRETDQNDRRDHAEYNAQHVHLRRALAINLRAYLQAVGLVVVVHEVVLAVVLVRAEAQHLVVVHVDYHRLDAFGHELLAVPRALIRIAVVPGAVHLALHAALVLLAATRAGRALVAVLARIPDVALFVADTLSAYAIALREREGKRERDERPTLRGVRAISRNNSSAAAITTESRTSTIVVVTLT